MTKPWNKGRNWRLKREELKTKHLKRVKINNWNQNICGSLKTWNCQEKNLKTEQKNKTDIKPSKRKEHIFLAAKSRGFHCSGKSWCVTESIWNSICPDLVSIMSCCPHYKNNMNLCLFGSNPPLLAFCFESSVCSAAGKVRNWVIVNDVEDRNIRILITYLINSLWYEYIYLRNNSISIFRKNPFTDGISAGCELLIRVWGLSTLPQIKT